MSSNDVRSHRWLARATLAFVALAAVLGWSASFVGLHEYGAKDMTGFNELTAWLIPGAIDGAAFACSLATYRASIKGRTAFRGRLLMWAFTGASAWINWIHQVDIKAQIVAAGLPIAAVAVFDVVLIELRADHEEKSGKPAFRLRPGLLLLRWMVNRSTTSAAFREQIESIPVSSLAGIGASVAPAATNEASAADQGTTRSAYAVTSSSRPDAPGTEPEGSSALTGTVDATGRHDTEDLFAQVSKALAAENVTRSHQDTTTGSTATPATAPDSEHTEVFAYPEQAEADPATPVADFSDRAEQTQVMPVIDNDVVTDEMAALSSDAERIRYAAQVLGHDRPSEIVTWLAGHGYEVTATNARVVLTRARKKQQRTNVVALDGKRHAN